MNDSPTGKPISAFDEICRITRDTMQSMDMETLLRLRKQAVHELDRAKIVKGCIDTALSLKREEAERAAQEADDSQPSLLD